MHNFYQSLVMTNTQVDNANGSERENNLNELAETLKGLKIDSKINSSTFYNSAKNDAEGYSKRDQFVDTYTNQDMS